MTKKEMFVALRAIVADNAEMVDFIDHEISLLDRKSATPKKPTKVQLENEALKAEIVDFLRDADAPKAIRDLQAEIASLAELSNQRVTHLLTALVKGGILQKEYVKKTPFYSMA